MVYAAHLAWPQADATNTQQSKDLYIHAIANFNGASDRPWYLGNPGNFQINVAGVPFLILGDLNSFQNQGKWTQSDIQVDETAQWDWVISRGLPKRSGIQVPTQGATDHSFALAAVYSINW